MEPALASESEGNPASGMPATDVVALLLFVVPPLIPPQMEDTPFVFSKLFVGSPDVIFSNMTGVLVESETLFSSPSPVGSWGSSLVEIPVTEDAALGGTGERCSVPGVGAVRRSNDFVNCGPGGGRNDEPKLVTPPSSPFG